MSKKISGIKIISKNVRMLPYPSNGPENATVKLAWIAKIRETNIVGPLAMAYHLILFLIEQTITQINQKNAYEESLILVFSFLGQNNGHQKYFFHNFWSKQQNKHLDPLIENNQDANENF